MNAAYIRVSTQDQNYEAQRDELTRWAAAQGIALKFYEDVETGKTLRRPGFERLQRDIHAGKVEAVIVWKLDRLARSYLDGVRLIDQWLRAGVRLVSVTQQIDLSGVLGQMFAGILFAVAEMELTAIKDRQRIGIDRARARGTYKGRKAGTIKGEPQRAFELREKGLTIDEIAAALKISRSTVYNYLRRDAQRTIPGID